MAMTAVDNPTLSVRKPSKLVALAASLYGTLKVLGMRAVAPHRASLTRLADIPLTVVGTGCIDYASFHLGGGWGWLVTGLSLILLEHIIADDSGGAK